MPTSFIERYVAGEHQEVWQDLLGFEGKVHDEPLHSQAYIVIYETMQRARYNVATLGTRLQALDYQFAFQPWEKWDKRNANKLSHVENRYGSLPLSLRAWYQVVGLVDFTGYHPRLSRFAEWRGGEKCPVVYSDPLVVGSFPRKLPETYYDYEDEEEYPSPPYPLEIAPDPINKAGYSGSAPLAIYIPAQAIDAQLVCDPSSGWNGVYFVDHLRTMFKYGGFAGLAGWEQESDFPSEEIAFLTKGLLPI